MIVDFNSLPDTSRIWIYQANRMLTKDEETLISDTLQHFISNWKRHGDDVKGSFIINYNQFIILAVDEAYTPVSGCAIDASVHILREIEKKVNIDLFNKLNVSYKDGNKIHTVSLKEFKNHVKLKKITNKTLVFNNLIHVKAELESAWQMEAGQSWHAKFL